MKNGIVKSKAVTPTTVADKTIMIFQHPELYFFPHPVSKKSPPLI